MPMNKIQQLRKERFAYRVREVTKKPEFSDKEDIILSYLMLKPKDSSVVSLIDVFSTLSSIFFSIVLYLYFVTYTVNSHVCLWVLFLTVQLTLG